MMHFKIFMKLKDTNEYTIHVALKGLKSGGDNGDRGIH